MTSAKLPDGLRSTFNLLVVGSIGGSLVISTVASFRPITVGTKAISMDWSGSSEDPTAHCHEIDCDSAQRIGPIVIARPMD